MKPRLAANIPDRAPDGRPMICLRQTVLAGASIQLDTWWVAGEEGDTHGEIRELPTIRLEDMKTQHDLREQTTILACELTSDAPASTVPPERPTATVIPFPGRPARQ